MRQSIGACLALLLCAGLAAQTTTGSSPDVLLKAALQKEQIDKDLPAALAQYKAIVEKFPKDPAAVRALLQMAGIYERGGQRDQARGVYERVVREFQAGSAHVAAARARLQALDEGPIDRRIEWPESAGNAPSAALSPDNRAIAYFDAATKEIFVRDLVTGAARRLTKLAADGQFLDYPMFSNDGKWVAFSACNYRACRQDPTLRLLPATAGASTVPRVLTRGTVMVMKDWSPDNSKLLVAVETPGAPLGLGLVSVADGTFRLLRDRVPRLGRYARFSPNGSFVVYDGRSDANAQQQDVFLVRADTGESSVLMGGPDDDNAVGWSPDGRHVIFYSNRQGGRSLWAMAVRDGRADGAPILLRPEFNGDPIHLSARGSLLYERLASGGNAPVTSLLVTTIDSASTNPPPPTVAAHDRRTFNRFPRWSRDGRLFTYVTSRPDGPKISIRANDTGIVREVPLRLDYIWTLDWSPDNRTVVFRAKDLQSRSGIFLVDTQTGAVRDLALDVPDVVVYRNPIFNRDGSGVYYFKVELSEGPRRGWSSYVERNLAEGTERELDADLRPLLTPGRGPIGASPDGRVLLAVEGNQAPSVLYAYDVATKHVREAFRVDQPLAFNPEDGLQWMPDGRSIIANVRGRSANERELWLLPMDGRAPQKLDPGATNIVNSAIAVDPDGQQVAFVAGDPVPSKTTYPETEFWLLERFYPKDQANAMPASASHVAEPDKAGAPAAQSLTGRWTGQAALVGADGPMRVDVVVELTQSGQSLSGVVTPMGGAPGRLSNGRVDGSSVSFEVNEPNLPRVQFSLKLIEGHLKGTVRVDMGAVLTGEIALQRRR